MYAHIYEYFSQHFWLVLLLCEILDWFTNILMLLFLAVAYTPLQKLQYINITTKSSCKLGFDEVGGFNYAVYVLWLGLCEHIIAV